jgi:hypothetical protein
MFDVASLFAELPGKARKLKFHLTQSPIKVHRILFVKILGPRGWLAEQAASIFV